MAGRYFCAHCDREFVPEEPARKPRCPQCMRRSGVEPVEETPEVSGSRRRLAFVALGVLVLAASGYGLYRSQRLALEDVPPMRPLEPRELAAYLDRDGALVGSYAAMFSLPADPGEWPEARDDLAARLHGESSVWSLEHPLPREVLTAEQTLASAIGREERVKLYPLEAATAMVALLRERGARAMVAEITELPQAQAPADPSGVLGYFVAAVYDGEADEPSAYPDPWGGRTGVEASSVRVLSDTEVVGAALSTEAARMFARSGDGTQALSMAETALRLDPRSPSARVAHATILAESGGLLQSLEELEAAAQLRPDGPRKLHLVQLKLAEAALLEANGEAAASEARFAEANRIVADIIEAWPRYGRAHLIMATVHLALGDRERAFIELEAAESLSPELPALWAVWAQYDLANEAPAAAVEKIGRALQLDGESWQLRVQAASVFIGAGEVEAAREQAEAALELVTGDRRAQLRSFLDEMLATEEPVEAPADEAEPALILGDPSELRLRDPGETLKLDLDP